MKNNIKLITDRMFKKQRVLVTALLAFVFVLMSVGYAAYYTELKLEGTIALEGMVGSIGDLDFTSIDKHSTSSYEADITFEKKKTEKGINFDVDVTSSMGSGSWLRYEITVVNNSSYDYTYVGSDALFSYYDDWYGGSTYDMKNPVVTGMLKGDVIGSGETKTIYLSFMSDIEELLADSYTYHTLDGKIIFSFEVGDKGIDNPTIMGTIPDPVLVLNSNNVGVLKFNVINLFDCSQVVSFHIDNSELEILNPAGTGIDETNLLNKNANETLGVAIQIRRNSTARSEYTTKLYATIHLLPDDTEITVDIGTITVTTEGEPTTPAESIGKITVSGSFSSFLGIGQNRSSTVKITNSNNFDITDWVLRIDVNAQAAVSNAYSDGNHYVELNTEQDQIYIYSRNKYNSSESISLGANSTVDTGTLHITVTGRIFLASYYEPKFEGFTINAYYNGEWHYGIPVTE